MRKVLFARGRLEDYFFARCSSGRFSFQFSWCFFMGRDEELSATLSRSHLGHALVSVFPAHLLFFSLLA